MADRELEKRITQIEDVEAIRKLKARYCLYIDRPNEDAWISLFTENSVWQSDKFGIHEGREAIRAVFRSIPDFLRFAVHYVTNPIIEMNGDHATGNWLLLEPCTFAQSNQSNIRAAVTPAAEAAAGAAPAAATAAEPAPEAPPPNPFDAMYRASVSGLA